MKKLTNYGKMLICMALVLVLSIGATIGITMTYFGDSKSGSVEIKIGASIYFDETNGVGVAVQDGTTAIVPSQSVDVTTTLLIKSSSDTNVTKGVLKVIPSLSEDLEGADLTLADGETYDVYLGGSTTKSDDAVMVVANNALYLVKASDTSTLYEITPSTSGLSVKFSVPVTFSKDINNDLSGQSCTIEMKGVVLQSGIVDTDGNAVALTIDDFDPYFGLMVPQYTTETVGDKEYIYFGSYPQTIKKSSVTITSDPVDENGYYTGSDGEKYAKLTAKVHVSGGGAYSMRGDATTISLLGNNSNLLSADMVTGETYYFKVEPLKWRVLSKEDDTALIVCDNIITAMAYDAGGDNNYKDSDLRAFLIGDFYNTAFTTSEQVIIQTTIVDNSLSSTGYSSNDYVCENTEDKIFALSKAEVKNTAYGFSSAGEYDENRQISGSDYACANNLKQTRGIQYVYYWLRTPSGSRSDYAEFVSEDGYIHSDYCSITWFGVVPALNLSL